MRQELLDILNQYEDKGDFSHANVKKQDISVIESMLKVTIPEQYMEFLMKYGQGGIGGLEILGIGKTGNAIFATKQFNIVCVDFRTILS